MRPGHRPFWLALSPTRCTVRNLAAGGCVIAVFLLQEGDGLALPEPYLRVDHNWLEGGELIPMGSRASLDLRSREILTRRKLRGQKDTHFGIPLLVDPSVPPESMELHG